MTKKDFKEQCSFHEYGYGKNKHNAIYFDWKDTDTGRGYKYGVAAAVEFETKAEPFNHFYDWVINFQKASRKRRHPDNGYS